MNLKLYDISKSLYRWKYRIVAVVILAFFAARLYVGTIQSSSGKVLIQYNDESISNGTFPDGSEFDQYQIASPEVLQNVINALGLTDTVETLRRRIDVSPVIPNAVQELQKAKNKDGEEYEYHPNTFIVTYTGKVNQPAYKIRELMDMITFKYLDYYSESYNEFAATTNALADKDIHEYDYIEVTEIMENNIQEIIDRLKQYKEADADFRSTVTGASFQDLIYRYEHLQEFNIPMLYADIYKGKVSKNANRLVELYMQRYNEAILKQKNFNENADMTKTKMDSFSNANKEVPNAYNYRREDQNNDELAILDNIYDGNNLRSNSKTTYDSLIEDYTNQLISANDAYLEADHDKKIADIFSKSADEDVDVTELTKNVEQAIDTATKEMETLYDTLSATIDDYNDFNTQKHISLLTGVKCYENVSASLYEMIAIVLSGGLMVLLAIALEIIKAYQREKEQEDNVILNGAEKDNVSEDK